MYHLELGSKSHWDGHARPRPSATSMDVEHMSTDNDYSREDDDPRPLHTPFDPLSIPQDVSPLHSPNHSDGSTLLEPLDKPIRFLQEFRRINALRQHVQDLRVRVRDERDHMKLTRKRMLSQLARVMQPRQDATQQLQSLQPLVEELDSQEISFEIMESDLIPAEWKLKEAEQILYEDILGNAAIERSDVGPHAWAASPTSPELPFTDDVMEFLARQSEYTLKERLSALESADRGLRSNLEDLERNHEALVQDTKMRLAAGVPLSLYSQQLIDDYPDRRGDLLRQMSLIAEAQKALTYRSTIASASSTAVDALFRRDQFSDVDTDADIQSAKSNADETLRLITADFDMRRGDVFPLLAEPVLNVSGTFDAAQSCPTSPDNQSPDTEGDVAESLKRIISKWILQCVKSSWQSFNRFVSEVEGYMEGNLSYETIGRYMLQTWFSEDVSVSHFDSRNDVESLRTSQLPDDKDSSRSDDEQAHMQSLTRGYRSSRSLMLRPSRHISHSRANTL
ncbi:hypothetical protein EDD37DRAFT_641352 [Exophiala viscosa]|uniref:uncharacterized protein n=1 Tax=Exophiala viscosa TaxID=2486360 RepID=UPI00219CD96A|nr:hypothetical protein EDD37DRAFT_641352 [Exophiala viscosa]